MDLTHDLPYAIPLNQLSQPAAYCKIRYNRVGYRGTWQTKQQQQQRQQKKQPHKKNKQTNKDKTVLFGGKYFISYWLQRGVFKVCHFMTFTELYVACLGPWLRRI